MLMQPVKLTLATRQNFTVLAHLLLVHFQAICPCFFTGEGKLRQPASAISVSTQLGVHGITVVCVCVCVCTLQQGPFDLTRRYGGVGCTVSSTSGSGAERSPRRN